MKSYFQGRDRVFAFWAVHNDVPGALQPTLLSSSPTSRLLEADLTQTLEFALLTRRRVAAVPAHDRHRRDCAYRRSLDDFRADGGVHQCVAFTIVHAVDLRLFEQDGGIGTEDLLFLRYLLCQRDGTGSTARNREPGGVFRQTDRSFDAAGSSLTDMTRHTRDLRVIEGFDTDVIVGADEPEGSRDTPDLFSLFSAPALR